MADINVDDITNSGGTGVFDKLMESINSQIETQYLNNRITGADYANVYLGSVQAALSQSIQFTLQEQLTEAQVEGVLADNVLKAKQLELATKDLEIKTYELANTLPAQLAKIQKDTDVTERQMVEAELTGTKQRTLLDTEEELKTAQVKSTYADRVLKDKQAAKLGLDTVMKRSEDAKQTALDNDTSFVYTPNYEE